MTFPIPDPNEREGCLRVLVDVLLLIPREIAARIRERFR